MLSAKLKLFNLMKFSASLLILLSCLLASNLAVNLFEINFPSALIAMLLLFLLLCSGIIKAEWIAPASEPILKYMALFFIPAGVGVVDHLSLITAHWPLFIALLILTPLVGLFIVSYIAKPKDENG